MLRKFLASGVILCAAVVGCSYSTQNRKSSNLMEYLYPDASVAPEPSPQSVTLQLPLRIGIAFVPTGQSGGWNSSGLATSTEQDLLEIVRKSFEEREWVKEIVIIPSQYLQPGGGFANLEQVARLYNVDVVALASIDQIQHSDPTKLSFLYLSIVGAYVLPLDQNETRTLIDVAAFHVPTRTFLLRAPGQSMVKGTSTAVEIQETLRDKSSRGFKEAMANLAVNLDAEIGRFRDQVATGTRDDVQIVTSEGRPVAPGGGSATFGPVEAAAALALACAALWRRRWSRRSR